jgi:hypothetical protein
MNVKLPLKHYILNGSEPELATDPQMAFSGVL